MSEPNITEIVRDKYAKAALRVTSGEGGCCGTASSRSGCDPVTGNLYALEDTTALPEEAVRASLGCGNPTALAQLRAGEVVLDLGSGGGIDVLLSAQRVGPTGKAYGLDMTDEMLALARENQRKAGVSNVEFLKGAIEASPCPTTRSTWSSRTASSISRPTRIASSPRHSASSSRAGGSPSPTWWSAGRCPRRSGAAWSLDRLRRRRARGARVPREAGQGGVRGDRSRGDARLPRRGRPRLPGRQGAGRDAIAPQVDGKFLSAFVRARKPAA